MQITLNTIPFDIRPVEEPLRLALVRDPGVQASIRRVVWAWDGTDGRFTVPLARGAVPLPTGVVVHVSKPGGTARAEGPTARMAERLLAAVGAKGLPQLSQAMGRVIGVPALKPALAPFEPLKARGPFQVACDVDFAVVEIAHAGRNLQAYLFLPSFAAFAPLVEGGAPEIRRPAFVVQPTTEAALALRRLAAARRLNALQAALGEVKVSDLPEADPRRALAARLGAEWRALQPKTKAA